MQIGHEYSSVGDQFRRSVHRQVVKASRRNGLAWHFGARAVSPSATAVPRFIELTSKDPMKNTSAPTLLRIDSSARRNGSVSRLLADNIENAWLGAHPDGEIKRRDLAADPMSHISETTIQGFYTPAEQMTSTLLAATALSDVLIAELKSAHTVLISAPIYNFSLPSSLKAWIDQVVRIGHSFAYDGQSFSGLVTQPRAVLALAYGAAGYQGPMNDMDHLGPYLTQLLGFLGLPRVDLIAVEDTTGDALKVSDAVKTAQSAIPSLFQRVPA